MEDYSKLANVSLILMISVFLAFSGVAQSNNNVKLNAVFISSDPVPVESGSDADISFKVVNNGDSKAENVSVEIVDSYPFSLKPDRQRSYSVGEMTRGQEYQFSTEVKVAEDASDGSQDFKVRINSQTSSRTVNIPVEVMDEEIELNIADVQSTPSQLFADTEGNKLNMEVVNNGDKVAENVVLNISLPNGFEKVSSFSERESLGNIKPGEVKTGEFTFDISKNVSSGEKVIESSLTYSADDTTGKTIQNEHFSLFLDSRPRFEVTNVESDLVAGSSGRISVTVSNVGGEKSESTRIRILSNSDLPFDFSSTNVYVGTLEPDMSVTKTFSVTPESSASNQEYLLDFEIRGVRNSEVFVEEKVESVNVADQGDESSISLEIYALIAGLVCLLVLVGYRRLKDKEE